MIPYVYSFGEYIIKEGEIPKGLYLIKKGQCKVASARIGKRTGQTEGGNRKLGDKKKIKSKHPLFN